MVMYLVMAKKSTKTSYFFESSVLQISFDLLHFRDIRIENGVRVKLVLFDGRIPCVIKYNPELSVLVLELKSFGRSCSCLIDPLRDIDNIGRDLGASFYDTEDVAVTGNSKSFHFAMNTGSDISFELPNEKMRDTLLDQFYGHRAIHMELIDSGGNNEISLQSQTRNESVVAWLAQAKGPPYTYLLVLASEHVNNCRIFEELCKCQ